MNKPTFTFNASADNQGQIFIDGTIGEDWWADDGGNTAKKISSIIEDLKASKCSSYHVKIHSLGGDVDHALAIYSLLKSLPNVTTEVIGMCASAATIIFMAGSERIMDDSALFLVHHCWSYSNGNAMQMERTVETMKTIDETMVSIYSEVTGMTHAEVEELMDANDGDGRWITADECKKKNLCTATSASAKAETRMQFFALADIKERNLPVPEAMEELSASTWAKITNLIKTLTTKPSAMKKNIVAAFAALATIFTELNADEENNVTLNEADLRKIDDHINNLTTAKAELETKVSDLESKIAEADAAKAETDAKIAWSEAKISELQALVDAHAEGMTAVNGSDTNPVNGYEAYQQNSPAYQQAQKDLQNY